MAKKKPSKLEKAKQSSGMNAKRPTTVSAISRRGRELVQHDAQWRRLLFYVLILSPEDAVSFSQLSAAVYTAVHFFVASSFNCSLLVLLYTSLH